MTACLSPIAFVYSFGSCKYAVHIFSFRRDALQSVCMISMVPCNNLSFAVKKNQWKIGFHTASIQNFILFQKKYFSHFSSIEYGKHLPFILAMRSIFTKMAKSHRSHLCLQQCLTFKSSSGHSVPEMILKLQKQWLYLVFMKLVGDSHMVSSANLKSGTSSAIFL